VEWPVRASLIITLERKRRVVEGGKTDYAKWLTETLVGQAIVAQYVK